MRRITETRRERLALAEDAGMGRLSTVSVLAGVLVGYGAFAVLAGLTAAILTAVNIDVDLQGDVRSAGIASAIVLGVVMFLSYLFGAYTAGRMARRAGLSQGLAVFVTSLVLAGVAAALVRASGATADVVEGVRNLGVPTSGDQWRDIGLVAGLASLGGMLLGSLVGGTMGERWHSKLLARALDPGVGPEAAVRDAHPKVVRAEERRSEINISDEQPEPVVGATGTTVAKETDHTPRSDRSEKSSAR